MGPQKRSVVAMLRGIVSLGLLLGLLVALPVGLLDGTRALVGVDGLSLHGGLTTLLSRPDQGQLFVWALAVVGWVAWASFALSVVVELLARLRGLPSPRLPALGWSQRGAAALLGAVFALLPASGAFAAQTASAVPVHAPAVVAPVRAAAPPAAQTSAVAPAAAPSYTVRAVRPAETLWSIAQQQLGSGDRWTEIAHLNEGRVVAADGSVFHAEAALRPGWTLAMPAGEVVTVRSGDTLAALADQHQVPGGWQALYAANRTVVGADPDLIQPGERLSVPAKPTASAPAAVPSAHASVAAPARSQAKAEPRPEAPTQPEPAAVKAVAADPTPQRADSAHGLPASVGAAGFLAASLLALVTRNRIAQQRRRPLRRRIPLPDGVEEQRYEAALRTTADPVNLDLLDRALRTLGMTCLTTGTELPALAAVAVRSDGVIDLHLDPADSEQAAAGIAPFTPLPTGGVWRCDTAEVELLDAEQARSVPAPYPALVTLGRTPEGEHVLLDLEQIRHLQLDGSPDDVVAVTRALVAELAASPLADPDQLRLTAMGSSVALVGSIGLGRLSTHDEVEPALLDLSIHRQAVEQVLTDCQVEHPRSARSQGVATASWSPALFCTDQPLSPDQADRLGWVLAGGEHRCLAAVTPAVDELVGTGLRLDARPGYHRIDADLPFSVALQRLGEAEFATALRLLDISSAEADVPAPEWTGHDPDDPFVFPVLATRSAATAGADPASATAVPLLDPDLPSAFTSVSTPGVAPRVLLLGPVRVIGATGVAAPARLAQLAAIAAYLVLHDNPWTRAPWQLDAVLGPDPGAALAGLCDWLGPAADGSPQLDLVSGLDLVSARLHPAVTSDWADFQELYRQGMNDLGPAADASLRRALDLVRSAPFAGMDAATTVPGLYAWAEPYRQDMLSAIVDASHELAKRRLASRDHSGCEAALHSGVAAVPEAEILHRGLIELYAATGRRDHLTATLTQLAQINASLGRQGYEPETVELFESMAGRRSRVVPQFRLHLPQGAT